MSSPNVFRMDEVLLKGGAYLGIAFFTLWMFSGPAALQSMLSLPRWTTPIFYAASLAPIVMLHSGWKLRQREKRAVALWKLLDSEVEVSALELVRNSDWTDESLDQAIRDLNNTGSAHLVWDRRTGWIQDGRLRRPVFSLDRCEACSAKVSVEIAIGEAASFACPFCGESIGNGRLAEEKARIVEELERDQNWQSAATEVFTARSFSPGLFVLMLIFFWPAALLYAVRCGAGQEDNLLSRFLRLG